MRISKLLLLVLTCIAPLLGHSQQEKPLTLEEAVALALANSDEVKIADSKVQTSAYEVNTAKNMQYPDVSVSGQYMRLTNVNLDLKLNTGSPEEGEETSGGGTPNVNQLMLGQANVSVPLFSGFRIHNLVKASENNYEAEVLLAQNDKEGIAQNTIATYINLYKAQHIVSLIEENLKSAHQRVVDFTAMEQNGLLARNDLLKAKLQEANIEITLEEAKKNAYMINYNLVTFLKLPANTSIKPDDSTFGIAENNPEISINRYDIQALEYQKQAAENQIKVAQSKYFPSLALSGGYIAADVQNALTLTNAMNVGIGLSYNLSDIFKAKSDIKVAKSRKETLEHTIALKNDNVKIEVENAKRNYQLALKKLQVYSQAEEQAIENYRIVKDKYDNGLADTNDLLEADVQQLQTRIDLSNANADITLTYYQLLNAEGLLTKSLNN